MRKSDGGIPMSKILPPGTVAPGFTLPVTPDQNLSLSDLTGRPVILAFYPADWSPVCGDQMALYNEVLPNFISMMLNCLGFRWMAFGVMTPLPSIATSFSPIGRFSPEGCGGEAVWGLS
jgi:hypothetical protein